MGFMLICRTNNRKPSENNVIHTVKTMAEAKDRLRKECKAKKEFLVYEDNTRAMFNSKTESWVIEIWSDNDYHKSN